MTISERIAQELGVNIRQVEAAVKLLDEGATGFATVALTTGV